MHFSALIATASAALFIPSIVASPIAEPLASTGIAARSEAPGRNHSSHDLYLKDDDDHLIGGELERVFGAIMEIPDEVLEDGEDATDKWLIGHGYRPPHDKRDVLDLESRELAERDIWDVLKCVGGISAFLATNTVAPLKLLRVKRYIKSLGGIREAAELLLKASTRAERLEVGGEVLELLAGEILGTALIADNC